MDWKKYSKYGLLLLLLTGVISVSDLGYIEFMTKLASQPISTKSTTEFNHSVLENE